MAPARIAIIGGGAAGYFGAIACAEANPAVEVTIYEASAHPLAKVRISGGGRCNVTHACYDPRELVTNYPRGARELLGPLHRFGPRETVTWFANRGVTLKTEADGRMFPESDNSATIIHCLEAAAQRAGVRVRLRSAVRAITRDAENAFLLALGQGENPRADRVLVATGGGREAGGAALARALGHTIEPLVPSLFTFNLDDARLRGLEGVAVDAAVLRVDGTKLTARGAALITHWGLSGPAVLRLSAWGARELHARAYQFALHVNWVGGGDRGHALAKFETMRREHGRKRVATMDPFDLPARLWQRLVQAAGVAEDLPWASLSRIAAERLCDQLVASVLAVCGRSVNKDEFVTCGGVRLREVDFRTMESRVCPGLYFAGEVLDLDGLTGGFNFQSAWTTGWIAGRAMAEA